MIQGIGNDIIELERIEEGYRQHGQAFLDRLFTPKEQAYCLEPKDPIPRLAGRFAAKEAIAKALGVGFGADLSWLDIEILPDGKGRPGIFFSERAQKQFHNPNICLSISHCKTHATAVAIRNP
jgi:holo-[acyl-carrier protein] synthase